MNPNKNCVIINLYIDDFKIGDKDVRSRDKQKLIQRQQDSENVPIWLMILVKFSVNFLLFSLVVQL